MEQVRDVISKGSSVDQLQYELKVLTKEDRQSLLDTASVHDVSTVIPPSEVLAMKSDCLSHGANSEVRMNDSVYIMRSHHTYNRWMREWKISFSTEYNNCLIRMIGKTDTLTFLAYEGSDTKTNLNVALGRYQLQIKELQKCKWRYIKYADLIKV